MKRNRWLWRWPIFTIAITAIFWGIWSLFAPVPVTTLIPISEENCWQLPTPLSRWWDIPAAGLWTLIVALAAREISEIRDEECGEYLGVLLSRGLAIVLVFGPIFGLLSVGARLELVMPGIILGVVLVITLILVTIIGADRCITPTIRVPDDLPDDLHFVLVAGIIVGTGAMTSVGISAGLVAGISAGLVAGVIFLLTAYLADLLGFGLATLAKGAAPSLRKLGKWLAGE